MNFEMFFLFICTFLPVQTVYGYDFTALYCYQCVSTQPGCGFEFNWLWHWSKACPEVNDKCVKIIDRKDASEFITRDCLSSLRSIRTDIPADHYEGCRPAAKNVRLAHYVNNSIQELDIRREYFDSSEWCFCSFDNRCNDSNLQHKVVVILVISSAIITTVL